MNPHLTNGQRLLQQGRAKEAVKSFREALATEPEDGYAHSLLALASQDAGERDAAADAAREGVRLSPGSPFSHYVLGMVHLMQGRAIDAKRAGDEALRLDPTASHHYYLLALVAADQKQFQEALDTVDRGLQMDPEDENCLNLRGQLLIRLKRRGEAAATAERALASSPDSAHSHANAGWTALHNNQPKQALDHFKESLRLEPGNDWAKAGLAEALKAKNPIYRVFLGFLLWMARMDARWQVGLVVGGYVLFRIGLKITEKDPELSPWLWPMLGLYIAFAWLTWIGVPLFDSLLRLSRYGRHALNKDQVLVSNALLGLIAAAILSWSGYLIFRFTILELAAAQFAVLTLVTVGILKRRRAKQFRPLLIAGGMIYLIMICTWAAMLLNNSKMLDLLVQVFIYGFIGLMWFMALGGGGQERRDLA